MVVIKKFVLLHSQFDVTIREERQRAEEGKEKFIDIKETKEVSEERRDSVMKNYVEFRETIILYNEEFDPGSG